MSVFTVDLQNQPGEPARLCEATAGAGVNLVLCATTHGESGTVVFIAEDEASAETVLQNAGIAADMRNTRRSLRSAPSSLRHRHQTSGLRQMRGRLASICECQLQRRRAQVACIGLRPFLGLR